MLCQYKCSWCCQNSSSSWSIKEEKLNTRASYHKWAKLFSCESGKSWNILQPYKVVDIFNPEPNFVVQKLPDCSAEEGNGLIRSPASCYNHSTMCIPNNWINGLIATLHGETEPNSCRGQAILNIYSPCALDFLMKISLRSYPPNSRNTS